ncbi:hypothetical protein [Hymenobacter guriensis]|uniref:ComEC/Rec2-related protein domain-containing protein n=1 Tax=Hymenobacter guriensis TaxID=2793065 RepID=A0ABS0L6X6_9BACT|nr:hypothetical protein [Hymenobacter guriensis]MBG8555675.1 hypothetical protein [Hymenobacter guriensis]
MLFYLKVLRVYYRSVLSLTLPISALVLAAPLLMGTPLPSPLFLAVVQKMASFPALIYLIGQFRPQQYWLYRNLHLAPWQLWAGVIVLDTLLLSVAHRLLAFLVAL